jgi:hypothetical protein
MHTYRGPLKALYLFFTRKALSREPIIAISRCLYLPTIDPAGDSESGRINHDHNAEDRKHYIRYPHETGAGNGLVMKHGSKYIVSKTFYINK